MIESNNGQSPSLPAHPKPKRHNAKHCPFAIREQIVNALANGDSKRAIARSLRVSNNTVTAVAEQDWKRVATRKAILAARYERIALLATEKQINQLESNEKIPLSVLLSVGGTAVDKVLMLRGEPSFTIQHDVRLDWERQQMAGLVDLINMFNLDPAAITVEHHNSSPVGNATIAVLKAVCAEGGKRAKAIDADRVRSLPLGDRSGAGETAVQKDGGA
jgi:hypothetical protein